VGDVTNWSGNVAIVGAYEYPARKTPGVHPFQIQADCVLRALDDAGLTLADVDGFATAASDIPEGGLTMSAVEVAEWIGIQPTWMDSTDIGGAAPLAHVGHAAAAIATGMAEVVVISYAATTYSQAVSLGTGEPTSGSGGPGQYEVPYGLTLVGAYAFAGERHMAEFGTTPEQLAAIAVSCREHASHNPNARYRDPITVEDVVTSPMIASPLHRLDCCVVTDGGGAIVVTSAERARDCRKPVVYVLGYGEASAQMQMNQVARFPVTPGAVSGPRAFAQAGMTPDRIDTAQVYDSFTITALLILEDLGFCAKGEGGEFVSNGRLGIDGDLPVNTDGGGLSSNHPGRRGIFTIIESVRQLRGEPVGLQVPDCDVALAHGSGGQLSTAATLILAK
jgi:acetyl-CoA acetyltransferase